MTSTNNSALSHSNCSSCTLILLHPQDQAFVSHRQSSISKMQSTMISSTLTHSARTGTSMSPAGLAIPATPSPPPATAFTGCVKGLNPIFSRKRIAEFQPVVRGRVHKMCRKLVRFHQDRKVLRWNRAWSAMTADIITEHAFVRSYDYLDSPGLEQTYLEALQTIYTAGHFGLHFPMLFLSFTEQHAGTG